MEVGRFEDGDAPRHARDRGSGSEPRAELAVVADPERRVAESCLYQARVNRVYEAARDIHTRSLPELQEIRARRVEVFDRIEATQAPRDVGSVLPKSFNLSTAYGDRVWIAPNATKHIWEETREPDPGRWVGSDPVLFGLVGEQNLAAICARWSSSERESVLTGR